MAAPTTMLEVWATTPYFLPLLQAAVVEVAHTGPAQVERVVPVVAVRGHLVLLRLTRAAVGLPAKATQVETDRRRIAVVEAVVLVKPEIPTPHRKAVTVCHHQSLAVLSFVRVAAAVAVRRRTAQKLRTVAMVAAGKGTTLLRRMRQLTLVAAAVARPATAQQQEMAVPVL